MIFKQLTARSAATAYLAAVFALGSSLSTSALADSTADQASYEKAIAGAEESRKKANSVGGEWRDVGKFIAKAKAAAKNGDYAKAVALAETARMHGYLGYRQAVEQQNIGLPSYIAK